MQKSTQFFNELLHFLKKTCIFTFQNKPGPPKPGDFQTIEVEASVPLELDYVMELIREGFFDEGNQDEVLKIDVQ